MDEICLDLTATSLQWWLGLGLTIPIFLGPMYLNTFKHIQKYQRYSEDSTWTPGISGASPTPTSWGWLNHVESPLEAHEKPLPGIPDYEETEFQLSGRSYSKARYTASALFTGFRHCKQDISHGSERSHGFSSSHKKSIRSSWRRAVPVCLLVKST